MSSRKAAIWWRTTRGASQSPKNDGQGSHTCPIWSWWLIALLEAQTPFESRLDPASASARGLVILHHLLLQHSWWSPHGLQLQSFLSILYCTVTVQYLAMLKAKQFCVLETSLHGCVTLHLLHLQCSKHEILPQFSLSILYCTAILNLECTTVSYVPKWEGRAIAALCCSRCTCNAPSMWICHDFDVCFLLGRCEQVVNSENQSTQQN